ncbi:hypothetical protein PUND_a1761 [Pseudoalteromonas undina]|uniref:Transposase n=1 Tax=Pseudoalteromonas carrageenovora IAM 12662 TaxID=1314868 RepID=A0ABR9ERT0_PSEVC|nr:hypothetical protein PH505_cl00040 [Pseudoalteromonas distincta]KAF7766001.1 hypothetical protein PUND_a1761 [Pseudoalteromonas undina]KAF7780062.1 hypothetical protein PMAN_a1040 [Pseudoalteromonas marina]MBE0383243.1 hypothetical protein [Pseudoalteromonas carrageenovora IAM 12662]
MKHIPILLWYLLNGRYVGFGYRKTSKGANMQRMANCRR